MHYANNEKPAEIDSNQMATAQKLLLFWRKPAVCVFSLIKRGECTDEFCSESVGGMALILSYLPRERSLL